MEAATTHRPTGRIRHTLSRLLLLTPLLCPALLVSGACTIGDGTGFESCAGHGTCINVTRAAVTINRCLCDAMRYESGGIPSSSVAHPMCLFSLQAAVPALFDGGLIVLGIVLTITAVAVLVPWLRLMWIKAAPRDTRFERITVSAADLLRPTRGQLKFGRSALTLLLLAVTLWVVDLTADPFGANNTLNKAGGEPTLSLSDDTLTASESGMRLRDLLDDVSEVLLLLTHILFFLVFRKIVVPAPALLSGARFMKDWTAGDLENRGSAKEHNAYVTTAAERASKEKAWEEREARQDGTGATLQEREARWLDEEKEALRKMRESLAEADAADAQRQAARKKALTRQQSTRYVNRVADRTGAGLLPPPPSQPPSIPGPPRGSLKSLGKSAAKYQYTDEPAPLASPAMVVAPKRITVEPQPASTRRPTSVAAAASVARSSATTKRLAPSARARAVEDKYLVQEAQSQEPAPTPAAGKGESDEEHSTSDQPTQTTAGRAYDYSDSPSVSLKIDESEKAVLEASLAEIQARHVAEELAILERERAALSGDAPVKQLLPSDDDVQVHHSDLLSFPVPSYLTMTFALQWCGFLLVVLALVLAHLVVHARILFTAVLFFVYAVLHLLSLWYLISFWDPLYLISLREDILFSAGMKLPSHRFIVASQGGAHTSSTSTLHFGMSTAYELSKLHAIYCYFMMLMLMSTLLQSCLGIYISYRSMDGPSSLPADLGLILFLSMRLMQCVRVAVILTVFYPFQPIIQYVTLSNFWLDGRLVWGREREQDQHWAEQLALVQEEPTTAKEAAAAAPPANSHAIRINPEDPSATPSGVTPGNVELAAVSAPPPPSKPVVVKSRGHNVAYRLLPGMIHQTAAQKAAKVQAKRAEDAAALKKSPATMALIRAMNDRTGFLPLFLSTSFRPIPLPSEVEALREAEARPKLLAELKRLRTADRSALRNNKGVLASSTRLWRAGAMHHHLFFAEPRESLRRAREDGQQLETAIAHKQLELWKDHQLEKAGAKSKKQQRALVAEAKKKKQEDEAEAEAAARLAQAEADLLQSASFPAGSSVDPFHPLQGLYGDPTGELALARARAAAYLERAESKIESKQSAGERSQQKVLEDFRKLHLIRAQSAAATAAASAAAVAAASVGKTVSLPPLRGAPASVPLQPQQPIKPPLPGTGIRKKVPLPQIRPKQPSDVIHASRPSATPAATAAAAESAAAATTEQSRSSSSSSSSSDSDSDTASSRSGKSRGPAAPSASASRRATHLPSVLPGSVAVVDPPAVATHAELRGVLTEDDDYADSGDSRSSTPRGNMFLEATRK